MATVSLITICVVGSCQAKAATLLNSQWAVSTEPFSQRVLGDTPGVRRPPLRSPRANVLSWNVYIITKLIRGCGWLTPNIWLGWMWEMRPTRQGRSIDAHIPGLFGYRGANTRTRRLLVFTLCFSLNIRSNCLCFLSPQAGKIIISYKGMNVHILCRFLAWAVILVRYIITAGKVKTSI